MTNPRVKTIVEDIEASVIGVMRKHRVTHDEYRQATNLLIDTVKAGEYSLLYDVFFEAEATDIGNVGKPGSPAAIEGPFYFAGAPLLARPCVMPQRPDEAGDVLLFSGRVTDAQGQALADAELDVWQADAKGWYSKIFPGLPEWNLRGRLRTDANGHFELRTIVPPPYEIPKDGPTGVLLNALGRHFYRPAHLHLKVRQPGFVELTSQLYFHGGEYLDSDVANAVRDGLVIELKPSDRVVPGAEGKRCFEAVYDFALEPARP